MSPFLQTRPKADQALCVWWSEPKILGQCAGCGNISQISSLNTNFQVRFPDQIFITDKEFAWKDANREQLRDILHLNKMFRSNTERDDKSKKRVDKVSYTGELFIWIILMLLENRGRHDSHNCI